MTNFAFDKNQTQTLAMPTRRAFGLRVSLAAWNILILGIIAVLGVWYLVAVNVNMAKGYEVRDAQTRLTDVESVARSNQVKLSALETVGNLTSQAVSLGMVPVATVEYVSRSTSGLSMR